LIRSERLKTPFSSKKRSTSDIANNGSNDAITNTMPVTNSPIRAFGSAGGTPSFPYGFRFLHNIKPLMLMSISPPAVITPSSWFSQPKICQMRTTIYGCVVAPTRDILWCAAGEFSVSAVGIYLSSTASYNK
jgi:hypothetical protein